MDEAQAQDRLKELDAQMDVLLARRSKVLTKREKEHVKMRKALDVFDDEMKAIDGELEILDEERDAIEKECEKIPRPWRVPEGVEMTCKACGKGVQSLTKYPAEKMFECVCGAKADANGFAVELV